MKVSGGPLKDDAHTVVGSGKTFAATRAEATEAGYAQLIVVRIPASILPCIGQTVSVTRNA